MVLLYQCRSPTTTCSRFHTSGRDSFLFFLTFEPVNYREMGRGPDPKWSHASPIRSAAHDRLGDVSLCLVCFRSP